MTTSLISNLITPREPQSMSCKHMELRRAKWTGRTSLLENVECSSSCVFEYNIGSLKTHFKDAIYHRLDKTLKFSTTKMQCAQENQ